ncbi:MAG: AAA family ATPase [Negativicutes bacterium]|nr:AAA family ATPase [Negativicutes bacterium]
MAKTFSELAFFPTMTDIISSRPGSCVTIMTGSNNSGKSAYLKKTISNKKFLYVGVNRFYSFHHLPLHTENAQELDSWFLSHQQSNIQQFQNFEGSFFNCSTAITRLKNDRRKVLFDTFNKLFGIEVEVKSEDPSNDFSNRFVSVGGESLSVTSSGTRLFLGILAALMDERFTSVAIDEPELGLSPSLQRKLADIVIRGEKRDILFPHNPHVVLSTHSHLFLDRDNPENNYVVSKEGDFIMSRPCQSVSELHDIQFSLLGNDLSELFLPNAVIFVEGATDKLFLEKISSLYFSSSRIVIESCNGDIAKRLNFWASSLGDIQISPYRTRTIVVYDKVKQAGIESLCKRVGLPAQNMIEWEGNGIEYVYPDDLLSSIYRKAGLTAAALQIDNDSVRCGEITYNKMELCRSVVAALTDTTPLPLELVEKFVEPLRTMMR